MKRLRANPESGDGMARRQGANKLTNHVATGVLLLLTSVGIIGWLIYLAVSLPNSYRANHWNLAWVGFDIAMVGNLLITSWAIWKKRQLAIPAAMVSGTFLIIDSWFDVVTSDPGWDLKLSIILAIGSCTLAIFLFRFSRRAIRKSIRNAYTRAGKELKSESLWSTPLMMFDKEDEK